MKRNLVYLLALTLMALNICKAHSVSPYSNHENQFGVDSSSTKSNIVSDNEIPVLVAKDFSFTEGPAADKEGNIFFTDQPNDKIWKYSTDGKLSVFMEKTGRSNGLYFDRKGNLISCADEQNQLWSISPDKQVTVLLKDTEGKLFNGPNDLWIDARGGIYFTDPYYQRNYWNRTSPQLKNQSVYYLPKGKKQAVIVEQSLVKPNGIIGTPDGRYLYVADIGANKTYRYKIGKKGSLSEGELFAEQGSDGMTIDSQGNIYLTGNGVTVYNSKGQKIEHIPVPERWTANVTFGGKERNILFITASKAVYVLKMKVKGG
jgi:gluconolactonase